MPMITTITGPNDFARTQALTGLVGTFVATHTDMALERINGDESSFDRMQEAVTSLPFLTERKLVVLREPSKQKQFTESFDALLKNIPDTVDVVLVEPKLDKRLSYYKTLKKATDFKEYAVLDAGNLVRWATETVKEQGGSLSPADARLLVDRIGANQQLLSQELAKLLAYNPTISKQSILQLTEPLPQSTVFELLDAALTGKTARAMELYREQRALKVEPQAIIAMLAWQLHVIAVLQAAGERSVDDVAREAKLHPFVVRKSQAVARRIQPAQLKEHVARLLALDESLKTTAMDADQAVSLYLLQLAQ